MRGWMRWTTRRSMALVAAAAALMSGLRCGERPGWHTGLPGGLRAGACRDDRQGRQRLPHGRQGSGTFLLGAWRAGPGTPVAGLEVRDGRVLLYRPGAVPVVLW